MRARGDFQRIDPALLEQIAKAGPAAIADAMRAMTPRQRMLIQAHMARMSFAEFVRQAWSIVEPAQPLVWGWHIEAICKHLEAVYRGEILKLVINVPPGHAKSLLVSVLWPAWVWTHSPQWRFICGSYGQDLAIRDSLRCRQIVDSEWYLTNFATRWRLREDQNTKDYFVNTASGARMATGVGGKGTGHRGNCVILDDPLKAQDAFSEAERDRTNRWISQTMSSRFDDKAVGRTVIIMQRLHANDPTGFVMKGGDYECLILPSEFEPHRRCITYHRTEFGRREFWRDPRQEEGELLFPAKFSREVLDQAKGYSELGPDGFAGQHQQRPAAAGGSMFKVDKWRFWRTADMADQKDHRPVVDNIQCYRGPANLIDLEELDETLISVDATFKKTTSGSYVAIHVWGKKGSRRLLLDRVHARMDFVETVRALLSVINRWPQARRKLIEGKANGDAIISTLEREHGVIGIEAVNPGSDDKVKRAHAMLPYQAGGNVELPDGAPWLSEYILEHALFPAGATNDDVDAQAQGLQGLERKRTTFDLWGSADLS